MSTPSGNVDISKNGFAIGSVTLDDSGNGSLVYTATAQGEDTLFGGYNGDSTHNPSQASTNEEIDSSVQNTVTTITTSPNPAIVGQQVTVSVSVKNV